MQLIRFALQILDEPDRWHGLHDYLEEYAPSAELAHYGQLLRSKPITYRVLIDIVLKLGRRPERKLMSKAMRSTRVWKSKLQRDMFNTPIGKNHIPYVQLKNSLKRLMIS